MSGRGKGGKGLGKGAPSATGSVDPEVLGSNPVKSKNNFASFMLTEIIS